MPSTAKFSLKDDKYIYFSGKDTILGNVRIITIRDKRVKSVKLRFCGTVKISSSDGLKYQRDFHNDKLPLRRAGILPAGQHDYSIRFDISSDLPSSLETKFDQLRYQIILEIEKTEGKYNNIFSKPITLVKSYDLNDQAIMKMSLDTEKLTTCCFGLRKTTPRYSLRTPVCGYAPGQNLKFTFEIHDKPSMGIRNYLLGLIRVILLYFDEEGISKKETRKLNSSKIIPDNSRSYQTVEDEIFIPAIPPTMQTNRIILRYILKMRAEMCEFLGDIRDEMDIVIGTIPLRETLKPELQSRQVINPTDFEKFTSDELDFIDSSNTEDINHVKGFVPIYPTYRNTQP